MDAPSSIAFYSVLLLCCTSSSNSNTVRSSINTSSDSINENSWTQQRLNGTTPLSAAERFRRLVPYVTYYIVGGGNDDDNGVLQQQQQQQYRHQNYENPFTSSTASPVAANNNNFYVEQNERKPSQQSAAQYHQHQQYDYQTSNQLHEQHASTTTTPPPEYLRFPSSPKFRRPIVIATTPQPAPHSNYDYYDYDGHTSPRRPIVRPVQHVEYFLPTVPPPPPPPQQQQQPFTSAKGKKTRRPAAAKPKRPSTSPSIATTDKYGALNELLNGYDLGNRLSNKITAENIGSNIQTLSDVLEILQKEAGYQETRTKKPAATRRPEYRPDPIDEYDTGDVGNPGRPGIDYPTLSVIPKTSFDCKTQRYKGFFGDPETQCQAWHYCDLNGGQASFLCPNGTIFNQVTLTCDWWFNVKCDTTAQLYVLNERLYKYIIPSKPSFPEDYEGPLVDKYLEDKFRETEKKGNQKNEQMPPMNITTIEPDSIRTPYQQLLDVDT